MQLYKNKTLLFVDFSKVFGRKIYQKPQKYDIIISRREGTHMMIFFTLSERNKKILKVAADILLVAAAVIVVWVCAHF